MCVLVCRLWRNRQWKKNHPLFFQNQYYLYNYCNNIVILFQNYFKNREIAWHILLLAKTKHIFQPQPSPLFKRCTSIGGGKKAFVDGGYSSVSFTKSQLQKKIINSPKSIETPILLHIIYSFEILYLVHF